MTDGAAGGQQVDPAVLAFRRAKAFADIGRVDDALAAVAEGLRDFPDDVALLTLDAWLLLKAARPGEAKPLLLELVASQPEDSLTIFLLSVAHAQLEEYPDARRAADRALELDPQSARYHLQIAYLVVTGSISAADRALALERVASALELEPDDPDTIHSAAEIHRSLGDTEQAKALVARGLAIAPEDQSLLLLRGILLGDYTPTSSKDYGGLPHAAAQVTAMSELLGMAPDSIEAGQVLFGRVWGQLLRLVDTPLIVISLVALTIGIAMGNSASLSLLYIGAGFAAVWPLFRMVTTRVVLSRAPKGYLRRMVRGGRDARVRLAGSYVALGVGVLGIAALVWLREASLVRWMLVLLSVASVIGGAAAVLWYKRYLDSAEESGFFRSTGLGFRSVRAARSSINAGVGRRLFVLALAGFATIFIARVTRADAAPVLVLAVAAWSVPMLYAAWRIRRISLRLADDEDAPAGVMPSAVGGPALGAVTLLLAATAAFGLAATPWLPSERDLAGTYTPYDGDSECSGRPANRLVCAIDNYEERTDEIVRDFEEIEIPEFDVPEITIPTFTPPPPVPVP